MQSCPAGDEQDQALAKKPWCGGRDLFIPAPHLLTLRRYHWDWGLELLGVQSTTNLL